MQKKGKIILAVIALLVLCGLLYWVTRPQDKGLTATGTVEATRYDVTAKVPGYVRELTLQAGDTLNEGDLVCRIDREDLRAQVLAANAGLAAARSGQVEAARAEVERLQAQVDAQQAQADGIDVESPASGTVLSKNFENNEFAPAGVPIVTVGDLDNCYVRVYVPSEDLARIQVGQAVNVYVDAYPGRAIAGTIQEISQQAEYTPRQSITARERANLVFAVKVAVQNQERIVKPGMPADVDFE
ncbi:MAG: efflux RND transporter periplasmic adaptor subunit [Negativicoccus succinicivorans]|nr:efflux RND transporter periplasmic adaptor subunit [Negativicoccus succinicivorans]